MDSLSQVALGAAIGVAVMGRRTGVAKAALWGGICGTLPDLDAFIDYGDPVSNMTLHRADSHALLWLTLAAPPIAWGIARLHGEPQLWRRWWLAVWLVLLTHPLLDTMTVYGTQLARPFTDTPFGVGSIFIIDPLYTLPLLAGLVAALWRRDARGRRLNLAGIAVSTAYLAWGAGVQQHVAEVARASLEREGIAAERVLVTPTAFNTVLWRVVAMTPEAYHEGFYSLLDAEPRIRFDRFDRGAPLRAALAGHGPVERIAWFSRGFYALHESDGRVRVTDLRMGQQPAYVFSFVVGRRNSATLVPVDVPVRAGRRPELGPGLRWLWQRMGGEQIAPPR
jgi:inner membrane protein